MVPTGIYAMIALALMAIISSSLGTMYVHYLALKHNRLDIPNERSSHSRLTPRGAGIAVAATYISGLIVLLVFGHLDQGEFIAIALPCLVVAIVGHLDDLGRVTAARWRLTTHFAAATVTVYGLGGLPALPAFGTTLDFGIAGEVIAILYLVWMLNLFNFMDGIDGVIGVETLTTCAVIVTFLVIKTQTDSWYLPALLGASVAGFLFFNWPPAKIFLGDVGSGFIGFVLGALSLLLAKTEPLIAWAWVIVLGVFIVDATVTLLRRLFRGERVYLAHRMHAYQHLAKNTQQHLSVSLGIAVINILWLTPVAWLVVEQRIDPIIGVGVAYSPLVILALYFKAGKPTI